MVQHSRRRWDFGGFLGGRGEPVRSSRASASGPAPGPPLIRPPGVPDPDTPNRNLGVRRGGAWCSIAAEGGAAGDRGLGCVHVHRRAASPGPRRPAIAGRRPPRALHPGAPPPAPPPADPGPAAAATRVPASARPRSRHGVRVDRGGEGGRAGAEIGGKARSPDPYVSRGPPDAVNAGPTPRGGPYSPGLSTLRNHSTASVAPRSDSGGWTGRGRVRPAPGGGGPECTASGVPRETSGPGALDCPQIRAPARPPRPALFSLRNHAVRARGPPGKEGSGGAGGGDPSPGPDPAVAAAGPSGSPPRHAFAVPGGPLCGPPAASAHGVVIRWAAAAAAGGD